LLNWQRTTNAGSIEMIANDIAGAPGVADAIQQEEEAMMMIESKRKDHEERRKTKNAHAGMFLCVDLMIGWPFTVFVWLKPAWNLSNLVNLRERGTTGHTWDMSTELTIPMKLP
jgi:hypothetical protein